MAKIRLWVFRALIPASSQVVYSRSHYRTLSAIRLGRWHSPTLEDFRLGLYFLVSGRLIRADDRYYAIACSLVLSLLNWVLIGLFSDDLDLFYLESWQVFLTCIVIFSGLSNVSSAIFQYRLNTDSLGNALLNNFKVSLMLAWLTAVGHLFLLLLLWIVMALDHRSVSLASASLIQVLPI